MTTTLCTIASIPLERNWPTLSQEEIAFAELEADAYFPFINKKQIPFYISQSIEYGEKVAKEYVPQCMKITELINRVIQKKVSIEFIEKDPSNPWVRAQYIRKPPEIRIYQSSMKQLKQFFKEMNTSITTEEIIALHLFHEWFHYLEEKKVGRTDSLLPRVITGRTLLLPHKKRIGKTREIAAHAFTKKALDLPWSPLILDYLLMYTHKGLTKIEIREKFQQQAKRYEKITEIEEIGMESE